VGRPLKGPSITPLPRPGGRVVFRVLATIQGKQLKKIVPTRDAAELLAAKWRDGQAASAILLNPDAAPSTAAPVAQENSTITKQEWLSKATSAAQFLSGGQIVINRDVLFRAVGEPTSTQSQGDTVYLYWDCADGRIQIVAPDPNLAQRSIVGHINTY
jgi:hypothetical protein